MKPNAEGWYWMRTEGGLVPALVYQDGDELRGVAMPAHQKDSFPIDKATWVAPIPAPESFANAPPSISEIRAGKDANCTKWTPRDALIDLLRSIDRGEVNCDALVIAWRDQKPDGAYSKFSMAAPNALTGLGLLSRAMHRINEG